MVYARVELIVSLRAWDWVASARRGLPFGRKIYLRVELIE